MIVFDIMYMVIRNMRPRCVFLCVTVTFIILFIIEDLIEISKRHDDVANNDGKLTSLRVGANATRLNETKSLDEFLNIIAKLSLVLESTNERLNGIGIDRHILDTVLVHKGSRSRLERLVAEAMLQRRPFKIGVLGASASAGACIDGIQYMYANHFGKIMSKLLTGSVEIYNGAIGGCDAQYYCYCAPTHLELERMDLILMEFAINDQGAPIWQERLLRKLLQLPNRPQIVYVNFILGQWLIDGHGNAEEKEITPLSRHYDIPSFSFNNIASNEKLENREILFCPSDDFNHPGRLGHELMALYLIQMTSNSIIHIAKQLKDKTFDTDKLKFIDEGLPEPLWSDARNYWEANCWSSQRPLSQAQDGDLKPFFNNGWNLQVPKNTDTRSDAKSAWTTRSPRNVMVFAVPIVSAHKVKCNVTLITLTCPTCGKAQMYLDNDSKTLSPVRSNGLYRLPFYNHIPNVRPGNHTLTVKSLHEETILVAGLVTYCEPCQFSC